ncbi:MAG TPA: hypothetical protein VKV40_13330 [Ktedonobacteraceae bacterium]|nr:hypothetical protein [Ktedonobacteraceae bacterium]
MSKIKMRCNTCGKWFQSANAKEVTCPDCLQKARREKQAAKNAPSANTAGAGSPVMSTPNQARPVPPPKPKPATGGGNPNRWFDTINDIKVGQPDQPVRPKIPSYPAPRPDRGGPEREGELYERESNGSGNYRDREGQTGRGPGGYRERGSNTYRENERGERGERDYRSPAAYRVGGLSGSLGQRPRPSAEGGYPRAPRPGFGPRPGGPGRPGRPGGPGGTATGEKPFKPKRQKVAKPQTAPLPRPKKEKQPPPAPFVPTPEQIAQVEARYLELAVPSEYDGIRTQISKELGIPKKAVKKIIKDLREREEIPSWWDLQTYKGPSEELEKIKELYVPLLPLPDVGVHRQIAEKLELKPVTVYQAIKVIRQEMGLPQYNDPALHGIELKPRGKKAQTEAPATEAQESETDATAEVPASEAMEAAGTLAAEAANPPVEQQDSSSSVEETAPTATVEPGMEPVAAVTEASTGPAAETETVEAVPASVDGNSDHERG